MTPLLAPWAVLAADLPTLAVGSLAALLLLVVGVLALRRVDLLVLGYLLCRTSLDALDALVPGPVAPAAAAGALLLVVVGTWLVACWVREGRVSAGPLGTSAAVLATAMLVGVLASSDVAGAAAEWTRLVTIVVVLLAVERLARRRAFRRRLVAVVLLAAAAPAVAVAVQELSGTGELSAGGFERVRGTFDHPNPLAAFLVLATLLALGQALAQRRDAPLPTRVAWWVLTATGGALLLLTYTRAGWLALAAGALAVAVLHARRTVAGLVLVVVLVVVLVPGIGARFADLEEGTSPQGESGNSLTWRIGYWEESLALVGESPVTGVGLSQVAERSEEGKPPHNDLVRALVETGLIGLAALVGFLVVLVRTGLRAATRLGRDPGTDPVDRGLALAAAGAGIAWVTMSLVANLVTQVVVAAYLAAMVAAAGAALHEQRLAPVRDAARSPHPVARGRG